MNRRGVLCVDIMDREVSGGGEREKGERGVLTGGVGIKGKNNPVGFE